MRWLVIAANLAACSGGSSTPPPPKPVPSDAPTRPLGPVPQDPAPPRLDDPRRPQPPHVGHPIDVILRSTPPNAQAAVDGVSLGITPAYWSGMADGREHEFTFVLPGHTMARYRFVPITSGVIYARLEANNEDADAGVPAADQPLGLPTQSPAPEPAPLPPPAPQIDAPPPVPPPVPTVTPVRIDAGNADLSGYPTGPQP